MRFRNFDFMGFLAEVKRKKFMSPRILLALAALVVCLSPRIANAQPRPIKGYAVQVAALSSRQSADELVRGLSTRGLNAYWVRGMSYGAAAHQLQLHRVRIGNFTTIEGATTYAEQLLGSGLLDAYAIAAYEPPTKDSSVPTASSTKVQSFAQKYQGRQFSSDAIDMIASVGTRGWLLLSSKSMMLTAQQGNSQLSRELAKLAASVGSRGWSLQNNLSKLLGTPEAPANLPSGNPPAQIDFASNSPALAANPVLVASPVSAGGPAATAGIISAKKGINDGVQAPPAPRASSTSVNSANVVGPVVNKNSVTPAVAGAPRAAAGKIYTSPPRLQGTIEMRDGRMWMKLRNTDSDRSFSGMARVTLSDDKNQQDVTPMQFTLPPDMEESFPVDEAQVMNGNWILMVYDEGGAARLVRGATLAPAVAPAAPSGAEQNAAQQGPPAYVTGVYDATWGAPQPASPNPESGNQAGAPGPGGPASGAPANSQNGNVSQTAPPETDVAPGQVSVTPRQIAVTTENVTLEFEIAASNPLSYIVVTLRAGDFQDVRQALMSTPQGRVPFLVPAAYATAGFYYEVKDESQRVLASGSGDFRRIARGN
jgi:hypothetical protein